MIRTYGIAPAAILFTLSFLNTAHAIYGEYLDPKEHIPQTCKLTIDEIKITKTPAEYREYSNRSYKPKVEVIKGATPIVSTEKDYFFCSSTIIAPDAVASAAHCYWPLFEVGYGFEPDPNQKPYIKNVGHMGSIKITPGFKVERRIITNARVTCPGVNGVPESKKIIWQNGWANPDFAYDGPSFDAAIFRVLPTEGPFQTPPLELPKDLYETYAVLGNWKTCRIFGYGHNNEGTHGILHGARAYQFSKISDWVIEFTSSFNAVGSGDSGGTLACKNKSGKDVLVGIVSQGTINYNLEFIKAGSGLSRFAPLSFGPNRRWMNTVLNKLPKEVLHSGKHDDKKTNTRKLDYIVTPFQFYEEVPGLMQDLRDCSNFYRSFMPKREADSLLYGYELSLRDAETVYNDIANEYQGYNRGDETIWIREVTMGARKGNRNSVADVLTIQLGRYISYPRSQYNITYPRLRMQDLIKYLRTEVHFCFNMGLSNDGYSRGHLKYSRDWRQSHIQQKVDEYWNEHHDTSGLSVMNNH